MKKKSISHIKKKLNIHLKKFKFKFCFSKKMVEYTSQSDLIKIAYIFQYMGVCVSVVGIVGNLLTFIVFMRKRFAHNSFSFYIKILILSDTIVLLNSFRIWAAFILDWNVDIIWPFFCTIGEYLPKVCSSVSLWLLALIAFDRWISIAYPNRFGLFKNRLFQTFLVCFICLANLIYNIIWPLNFRIQNDFVFDAQNNVTNVVVSCVIDPSLDQIGDWLLFINLVLVCTFYLELNIFI